MSILTPDTNVSSELGMFARNRARLSSWHGRRRSSPVWTMTVAAIVSVMLLPVASIFWIALFPSENVWPHLVGTILTQTIADTLTLAAGTGLVTLTVGTATAWLITMYRFPGRALLDRLLVLSLACPAYIAAYCYAELLDYAGPVQTMLRDVGGWHSVRDYWFPNVRSTGGAIFVLSAVLYPYVYITARASFVQQSVCALEVARTLGRTSMGTFWAVALPLARPALAAGVALVLMETLNDLGAVQHLGVQTLSASIYATWLQRSNLGGAAQLATVMLIFIALILAAERYARTRGTVHHTTGRYRSIPFQDIAGWKGYATAGLCALPFVTGFVVPFIILVRNAFIHGEEAHSGEFLSAAANSLLIAAPVAVFAVAIAVLLGYARRVAPNGFTRPAVRFAALGYALPGTVLAIGLLIPLAGLDNAIDAIARDKLGVSTGLLMSGSLFTLVLACVIRFLAVALGGIEAGMEKVSPNLDAAARTLGESALATLQTIHLPLLRPALGAAALLVFVDAMKELPATLLLRPFNFETLATHVYALAALEQFERASMGALTIIAAGLIPLLLLHTAVAGGRAGSQGSG